MPDWPGRSLRIVMLGLDAEVGRHGGSVRYLQDLRCALTLEGIDVCSVVLGNSDAAEPGVIVAATHDDPISRRLYRYAGAALRAARTADVMDVHFALYGLIPSLVAHRRRAPLVVHFHGPWAAEAAAMQNRRAIAWARRAVERAVYRRADVAVAISHAFASLLVDEYRVRPERVVVIPPAVDLERFGERDRIAARRNFGIPPDDWVVVAARRLVPRTGVDVLIRAWAELEPQSRARLIISGTGAEADALRRLATDLKLMSTVTFLGHVPDELLPALYAAADVSVLPSRALEGFGLSVLESLACGTPVLASDIGGLREALGPFANTCLVPPDNPRALAERLRTARSGELPSRAASRRYAEGFDRRRLGAEHASLFASLIDGRLK